METTSVFIIWIFVLIFARLLLRYLDGDFSIDKVEIIKNETYTVSGRDSHGQYIGKGEETRIVEKITYESNRVKYKATKFRH